MAVIETIMAANAAYGVIKKCLENGREVKDMVGHVGKFLSAEDELKEADCMQLPALGISGNFFRPKLVKLVKPHKNKKKKNAKSL